ncbi:glycosyltransferase family 8 protein [Niabella yanshanensis]|uniref:Glycosyltransferase family 8 protein n=1 Tax=Niabella yanshanensis TaxID=577386 RepID=A0ABZ0WCN5_9BACT|nr:glycosyltransferase family 8 protein [Niabella yanshanensis]WQD39647.1 glycosyltransferase family 8 protein [Niabella yanshanensis]
MNDTIHIVAATDNHYAILLAALVKSVEVNHHTPEPVVFTVIDDGISAGNRKKIAASVQGGRVSINWVNSKNLIPENIQLPLDNSAFPLTTYLRIFGPYAPAEASKVIYLDVDTIVLDDISKLWHTDLNNNLFAAVQDVQETVSCSWAGIPNYKELGIPPETKYFNAGVLLINAKRWRDEQIAGKVIQFLHENRKHINYADQYGLNGVLYNQWLQLDPQWNWFAFKEHQRPALIHFLDIKPIFKNYKSEPLFQKYFFEYLNQTPFKGTKLIAGNRRILKKIRTRIKKALMSLVKK